MLNDQSIDDLDVVKFVVLLLTSVASCQGWCERLSFLLNMFVMLPPRRVTPNNSAISLGCFNEFIGGRIHTFRFG